MTVIYVREWLNWLALILSVFSLPTFAQNVATDRLLRQSMLALEYANYLGAFTYEFGGGIDAVEVAYHVDEGVGHHVIKNLNGKPGKLERHNPVQVCPSVGSILFGGGSIQTRNGPLSLHDNYNLAVVGRDRIADRSAWVMEAVPRDGFRYGVSLTLDEKTGLPLRVMMMNRSNVAIERLQFVSLDVSDQTADARADVLRKLPCEPGNLAPAILPELIPDWLPRGFVLAQHELDARQRSVATYTDGIASFTLFMHRAAPAELKRKGLARRGATLALLSTVAVEEEGAVGEGVPWQIALVGEVPAVTAKQVVASLRKAQ